MQQAPEDLFPTIDDIDFAPALPGQGPDFVPGAIPGVPRLVPDPLFWQEEGVELEEVLINESPRLNESPRFSWEAPAPLPEYLQQQFLVGRDSAYKKLLPGLYEAAYQGSNYCIDSWVTRGEDVNQSHSTMLMTPLAFSAQAGKLETCRYLVEIHQADPNAGDYLPVAMAVKNKHLECVRYLKDETVLSTAHLIIIEFILGDIDNLETLFARATSDRDLNELFWHAADYQVWDIVAAMLHKMQKVDCNYTLAEGPDHGITPFWFAAFHMQWNIVTTMQQCQKDADCNASAVYGPHKGKTPFWFAAFYMQWNIVTTMQQRQKDADCNASAVYGSHKGKTVLWLTAYHEKLSIVRSMIQQQKDADCNASASYGPLRGFTPLSFVAMKVKTQGFSLLTAMVQQQKNPNFHAVIDLWIHHNTNWIPSNRLETLHSILLSNWDTKFIKLALMKQSTFLDKSPIPASQFVELALSKGLNNTAAVMIVSSANPAALVDDLSYRFQGEPDYSVCDESYIADFNPQYIARNILYKLQPAIKLAKNILFQKSFIHFTFDLMPLEIKLFIVKKILYTQLEGTARWVIDRLMDKIKSQSLAMVSRETRLFTMNFRLGRGTELPEFWAVRDKQQRLQNFVQTGLEAAIDF